MRLKEDKFFVPNCSEISLVIEVGLKLRPRVIIKFFLFISEYYVLILANKFKNIKEMEKFLRK